MADNLTQYAQKKLLDHTLGLAAYTMPSAFAALFTTTPGETGSLTGEVTGGSYARVALSAQMGAATLATGIATNTGAVTFATPSADWGMVTTLGVMDASSAGNVLAYAPLLYPTLIISGATAPSFAIGSILIAASIEGGLTKYLAKKWLDHLLGKSAFTMPTTVYLGLLSDEPTADGTLTSEIAVGNYAREAITAIMGSTDLATGIATNGDVVEFNAPTADYSVTHFGVLDALSSGNMLMRASRLTTLNVTAGPIGVRLDEGGLQLRAT